MSESFLRSKKATNFQTSYPSDRVPSDEIHSLRGLFDQGVFGSKICYPKTENFRVMVGIESNLYCTLICLRREVFIDGSELVIRLYKASVRPYD